VIRYASLHRRHNANRFVDAAKVVVGEMQRKRRIEVFPFLRERVGQAREALSPK